VGMREQELHEQKLAVAWEKMADKLERDIKIAMYFPALKPPCSGNCGGEGCTCPEGNRCCEAK
jgi:hypothetical protein